MVYLDADIQLYENIDHLLDTPNGYFYAVMDCFCEKTWSHSKQYSIGYCQQCPDKVTWPADMGSPPPLYFNAGFFVFEPSKTTYENLLETLKVTPPTPFAEQVILIKLSIYVNLVLFIIISRISELYNRKRNMQLEASEQRILLDTSNYINRDEDDIDCNHDVTVLTSQY